MPAEDFFSSDEERNDSKELPDLMAQLAPLLREDIRTTNDLRVASKTDHALEAAKRAWRAAPGQRSGITGDYALMLAQGSHSQGRPHGDQLHRTRDRLST